MWIEDGRSWRSLAAVPGQYDIARDEESGVLRISAVGMQHADQVGRYLDVLERIVQETRARFGRIRVLSDLRNAPVRTQEAADRMREGNLRLYRSGDRVALIVETSLLKMQLRRTLIDCQNIFVSPNAAETWLMATD
ncbi:hypothetical protein ABS767_14870 [Sphingomonas sp. ST-64]|uniref:STAS/SEC14 domain-containing protein n=1 Tax=Sphingomonas plantiphila TaxID=3163295 RepID=A0ABW8YSW2_9SPHN